MSRKEEDNVSGEGWDSEELQSCGDDWEPGKEEGSTDSKERELDRKKGVEGLKGGFSLERWIGGGGRKEDCFKK